MTHSRHIHGVKNQEAKHNLPKADFPGVTDGPAGGKHLMHGFPGAMDFAEHQVQTQHYLPHHKRR